MGKTLSYVYNYFQMSPNNPIDFDKGKNDANKYFQGKLPKIKENLDTNNKFVDPYFSHDINAIINSYNPFLNKNIEENDNTESDILYYKKYFDNGYFYWDRISNILKNIDIKRDLNKGIAQRALGDCYLISFLRGYLKFQPEKFYKILGKCHPEIGYWEVNFINKNENTIVYVDDYIVLTKDLQPLFAGIRKDNQYVVGIALIIEKAYAKLHGSYMNIEGHNQKLDPYYFFTGLPSCYRRISYLNEKEIYSSANEYLQNKNVVTCGTINVEEGQQFPIKGVSENYSYLVTDTEIKKDNIIIELNNPWGENKNDIKNFDIDINDNETKLYIKTFYIDQKNVNGGELKIDIKSFMKYWKTMVYIKFKKDIKEPENAEKKNLPIGVPPEGLGEGEIDELFRKRIGILDYIGVESYRQIEYIKLFEKNPELGIFLLFHFFMNFGTTGKSFNVLFEALKK